MNILTLDLDRTEVDMSLELRRRSITAREMKSIRSPERHSNAYAPIDESRASLSGNMYICMLKRHGSMLIYVYI